jgi:hypothetical protein
MARLRARGGDLVLALTLALLSAQVVGRVPGTFASLDASIAHPADTVSSTSLYAPSIGSVVASGHGVDVTWMPPSSPADGNGNGYAVTKTSASAAKPASCPASVPYATYVGSSATSPSSITLSEPPSSAYSVATEGQWACYAVQTGYSPAGAPPWSGVPGATGGPAGWNSQDSVQALRVQLGFVVSSWSFASAAPDGTLDNGDVFTVVFNQPIVVPAGVTAQTDTICADTSTGQVFIATRVTSGACKAASESPDLLTLTSVGGVGGKSQRYSASYTVTANADGTQTITATITGSLTSSKSASLASVSFTASPAALTSQRGSPQATICSAGLSCLPAATPAV